MEFEVMQSVRFDSETVVLAVWFAEGSGFHEYAVEKGGVVLEVSANQYGSDCAALRDGLSHVLGDL